MRRFRITAERGVLLPVSRRWAGVRGVVVGDELVRGWAPSSQAQAARRAYALEMEQLWQVMEVYEDRAPLLGRVRKPRFGSGVDLVAYSKDAADYTHLDGTAVAW